MFMGSSASLSCKGWGQMRSVIGWLVSLVAPGAYVAKQIPTTNNVGNYFLLRLNLYAVKKFIAA